MVAPIPDLAALVGTVLAQRRLLSALHGERHWQAVARAGARLVAAVPESDPLVVFLFALLHDAQRATDGTDPDHGPRAAQLAGDLQTQGLLALPPGALQTLQLACRDHADGGLSRDPTIGVCWDADRLNLWRVGVWPDPRWLSTAPARDPALIAWSAHLQTQTWTWPELFAAAQGAESAQAPSPP